METDQLADRGNIHIRLVDSDFLINIWADVEATLRKTYAAADFSDEFSAGGVESVNGPLDWTRSGINGALGREFKHLIALGQAGQIFGGIFCVPASRNEGETGCDVGWIFVVPEASPALRRSILDEMMERLDNWLRECGFERIVTDVGTRAGAKSFSRYYGWVYSPLPEESNRWIKELH